MAQSRVVGAGLTRVLCVVVFIVMLAAFAVCGLDRRHQLLAHSRLTTLPSCLALRVAAERRHNRAAIDVEGI